MSRWRFLTRRLQHRLANKRMGRGLTPKRADLSSGTNLIRVFPRSSAAAFPLVLHAQFLRDLTHARAQPILIDGNDATIPVDFPSRNHCH